MPPSSSPAQSSRDAGYTSTSPAAEIFYTDEDVEVLHQIVVRAEQLLPTLPERERLPTGALFSAYDEILPTYGVDADHDSRYARLLFKIGGLRGQGNLMDKFQEVLQKQGINLEFDVVETQGSDEELDELRRSSAAKQSAISEPVQTEKERPKSRGRRNSESSAWDLDNDSSEQRTRRRSFSSAEDIAPGLKNGIYNTSGLRPAVLQTQSQPPTEKQNGEDPRDDIRTWLKSRPAQSHRERDESVSTHHSIRIHRRKPHQSHRDQGTATSRSVAATDEYQATSEETIPTSSLNHGTTIDMKGLPSDPNVPQGSDGLMQMKAALIYNRHLGFFLRHQIRIWRDKAVQQRENNFHLNLVAEHRDKRILLSAALDSWHRRLQDCQRVAETEKFFAHLERRAGRARDLFLLHKAFTHWAQCAIDEIERTSIARRHIVRTRIFNAWREITAVNELKVRRHILKRFFSVWKRRHNAIVQENKVAIQTYESNIVERVYWDWFFKWCSINAEVWRSQRVKRRILLLWANAAQDMKDQRDVGAEERRLWLAWNAWRFWKARTEEHARQDVEAETFHRMATCRNALKKWRRETQVIPAKSTVQTDVSSRLLRETFAIWLLRARRERQAVATDRMKIMREAWVNWRYKLRSQVLRAHVDDRVILQALYKWVLAERLLLVKRLSNQRLLHRAMQNLEQGWVVAREKRWDREDMAQTFAVQRTQSRALHCWQKRAWSQNELEEVAANFYTPRLLRGVLSEWSEQAQHIQKLQRWARDAKFYFLASKTLKIWKASTEIKRRERRRNAYGQVRRIHKMNLASRMLQNWHSVAQKVVDMESQALNVVTNKTVINGMTIFDRWRARAEEVAEMEAICQEKILRKTLTAWRDRTVNLRAMGSAALVSFHERQQDRAIKKWNLRTLQLGAQSNYALDIRERNAKKNFRKIFSYWQQKTEQKRPIKKRADLGTTERAEAWSDFGEEIDMDELTRGFDDVNASLIPGYLSTPSKRTERVMAAAARLSSTTPRAPLSTPFERHLRAQYSGNALPSSRRGAGKSRLGMRGGFEDIPEG